MTAAAVTRVPAGTSPAGKGAFCGCKASMRVTISSAGAPCQRRSASGGNRPPRFTNQRRSEVRASRAKERGSEEPLGNSPAFWHAQGGTEEYSNQADSVVLSSAADKHEERGGLRGSASLVS